MARTDFVLIQLTAAGQKLAENGSMRVIARHIDYAFTGSKPVEVLTSEWARFFSRQRSGEDLLFELAPQTKATAQAAAKSVAAQKGE